MEGMEATFLSVRLGWVMILTLERFMHMMNGGKKAYGQFTSENIDNLNFLQLRNSTVTIVCKHVGMSQSKTIS